MCVELNNGNSICKKVKDDGGCKAEKKTCFSSTDCCNGLVCHQLEGDNFGKCLKDEPAAVGKPCGPKGCKNGLVCFENRCFKVPKEVKKGKLCGFFDPFSKLNRPCEAGTKCIPVKDVTKCAKIDTSKLSCDRTCGGSLKCCDGYRCIPEVTNDGTITNQCREHFKKPKQTKMDKKKDDSKGDRENKDKKKKTDEDYLPDFYINNVGVPGVPDPLLCQLKRADIALKFKPNFPKDRPDVYIETRIDDMDNPHYGELFRFYPWNYRATEKMQTENEGMIPIEDPVVFDILYATQEKEGGKGFSFRYVSKNGPGAWNSCTYSPIAFDLDNSGDVERIHSDQGFQVDITGDGNINHLRDWFAPTEGILIDATALNDQFEDDVISGNHLLGDQGGQYADGFDKLDTYDIDRNGWIEGSELNGLGLWIDRNSNLIIDDGEDYTFADWGIVKLNTDHTDYISYAVKTDGSQVIMEDLWFKPFGDRRRRRERRRR